MQTVRTTHAFRRRPFGRRQDAVACVAAPQFTLSDDLKLFVTTFAAGFLFVSILIG
jgi:hypothetical protein